VQADSYGKGSLWWVFRELNERATLADNGRQSDLRKAFGKLESEFAEEIPKVMHQAIALMNLNQDDQAASVLDSFSQRCVDRALDEAVRLRNTMSALRNSSRQ
jgi:hypothetical protein